MIQYLQDVECETLSIEYKTFTFPELKISHKKAFKLLKSGKWVFDNLTKKTLKHLINKTVPKYLSSFSNPNSICDNNVLYIGIDDDGIVHGIPSTVDISIDFIKKYINKSILENIRSINNNDVNDYIDKIKIEVIKLDKSEFLSKYSDLNSFTENSDIDISYNINQFNKLVSKMRKSELLTKEYIKKKRKFEHLINIYTSKLHEIINDKNIRNEIIEYIQQKTMGNKKSIYEKYKNIYSYCDIKNDYWHLIEELRSSKQYNQINYEEAAIMKGDKSNVFYWIMKWKDEKIDIIKRFKPVKIRFPVNYKAYALFLLSQVPKMIPSWIANNNNLNLYVLKINLPSNINKTNYLEYKYKNEWIKSYRTINNDGPCCLRI